MDVLTRNAKCFSERTTGEAVEFLLDRCRSENIPKQNKHVDFDKHDATTYLRQIKFDIERFDYEKSIFDLLQSKAPKIKDQAALIKGVSVGTYGTYRWRVLNMTHHLSEKVESSLTEGRMEEIEKISSSTIERSLKGLCAVVNKIHGLLGHKQHHFLKLDPRWFLAVMLALKNPDLEDWRQSSKEESDAILFGSSEVAAERLEKWALSEEKIRKPEPRHRQDAQFLRCFVIEFAESFSVGREFFPKEFGDIGEVS